MQHVLSLKVNPWSFTAYRNDHFAVFSSKKSGEIHYWLLLLYAELTLIDDGLTTEKGGQIRAGCA